MRSFSRTRTPAGGIISCGFGAPEGRTCCWKMPTATKTRKGLRSTSWGNALWERLPTLLASWFATSDTVQSIGARIPRDRDVPRGPVWRSADYGIWSSKGHLGVVSAPRNAPKGPRLYPDTCCADYRRSRGALDLQDAKACGEGLAEALGGCCFPPRIQYIGGCLSGLRRWITAD